jgi:hypothetical protein
MIANMLMVGLLTLITITLVVIGLQVESIADRIVNAIRDNAARIVASGKFSQALAPRAGNSPDSAAVGLSTPSMDDIQAAKTNKARTHGDFK